MSSGAAVLGVFEQIKGRIYISSKKVLIENFVFRLFSQFSVAILFLCAGLVTLQQLIGEHIKCILPPKDDIRPEALNQYCYIMSTYTLPHLYNETISETMAHFGVGPHNPKTDKEQYHRYYQWVPFVLFFQGIFFLVPHILWKSWEDNRIKAYAHLEICPSVKLRDRQLFDETDESKGQLRKAADCFVSYMNYNYFYSGYYVFCEILNFVIVILNIFLTDAFLGNGFATYGPDVINYLYADPETRIDPMSKVFPKVTKCDFRKYGPSGNIVPYDILCVLALNILNEKIYCFLWFWFVILSIIGGLNIIYRILVICLPGLRNRLLLRNVADNRRYEASSVCNKLGFSDWFHLKRVSDNTNGAMFGELLYSLNEVLNDSSRRPSIHSRSPVSLMSPPPTYDSSTLKITDTLDGGNDGKNSGLFNRNKHYPSLSIDSENGHEVEPLVNTTATTKF